MKPSSDKIVFSGLVLALLQLLLAFACYYTISELFGAYGNWAESNGYDETLAMKEAFKNNYYYYEVKLLLFGTLSFIYTWLIFSQYSEEIYTSIIQSTSISLVWLPVIWVVKGNLAANIVFVAISVLVCSIACAAAIKYRAHNNALKSDAKKRAL